MPDRTWRRSCELARAGLVAAMATWLVVATAGAASPGWGIDGFVNAFAYVCVVPRLFKALEEGSIRSVLTVPQPSARQVAGAGFTVVPGLAGILQAQPSALWRLAYIGLSLAGWWIIWRDRAS